MSASPDWSSFLDDTAGIPYYCNEATGETVWELPVGVEVFLNCQVEGIEEIVYLKGQQSSSSSSKGEMVEEIGDRYHDEGDVVDEVGITSQQPDGQPSPPPTIAATEVNDNQSQQPKPTSSSPQQQPGVNDVGMDIDLIDPTATTTKPQLDARMTKSLNFLTQPDSILSDLCLSHVLSLKEYFR